MAEGGGEGRREIFDWKGSAGAGNFQLVAREQPTGVARFGLGSRDEMKALQEEDRVNGCR